MTQKDLQIKQLLDKEVLNRNSSSELSYDKPDPLLVARRFDDEYKILLCALFGYGKASLIVKFLDSLNFDLLNEKEEVIKKELSDFYYRFQNGMDVIKIFQTFRNMKQEISLNEVFQRSYNQNQSILEALDSLINIIYDFANYNSQGFKFLVSSPLKRDSNKCIKLIGNAPYKRWFMYLRWMIRNDELDLGLWSNIDKRDLILPLDTHTFNVSKNIGLLSRKTYDLKSAVLITQKLREFDINDPIKYDFALYRIGQEKLV